MTLILETKKCRRCGIEKDFDQYHRDRNLSDGRKAECKMCRAEYAKSWYVDKGGKDYRLDRYHNGREFILSAKAKPCAKCKIEYPSPVMQFHHIRGEKLFNLGGASGACQKFDKIVAEIDKCIVLCANCHILETWIGLGL